jgi:hypothetical protein
VINISLNYNPPSNTTGSDGIDLILDWAAEQGVNISVSAGNIAAHRDVNGEVVLDENPPAPVRSPGSAYNVVTVGRTGVPPGDPLGPIGTNTQLDYNQVFINSASGPVDSPFGPGDRDKPDLVAPGTNITLANHSYTPGVPSTYWSTGINGTSVSSALVSGMMAQEVGYGLAQGMSTSPLVIKATMMNSATKVRDKDGSAWQPRSSITDGGIYTVSSPLDLDSGAGQVNGARLFQQYSAGQQGPSAPVHTVGWDLNSIDALHPAEYKIDTPLATGSEVDVTLDWNRHVNWTDSNNDGIANAGDAFSALPVSALSLLVLVDGHIVGESSSQADNVQLLSFLLPSSGDVSLEVLDTPRDGAPVSEQYGLAWSIATVPEPPAIVLAAAGAIILAFRPVSRRVRC